MISLIFIAMPLEGDGPSHGTAGPDTKRLRRARIARGEGDLVELSVPDSQTIEALRLRDPAAFSSVFREYRGYVFAVLHRQLGPTPELDDLVQQVFMRVFREAPEYRGDAPFRSWVRRTCFYVACRYLRTNSRHVQTAPGADPDELAVSREGTGRDASPSGEDGLRSEEIRRRTWGILNRMKPNKSQALVLHDFEGNTIEEVAKIMGCSRFTARSRLARARREFTRLATRDKGLMDLVGEGERR